MKPLTTLLILLLLATGCKRRETEAATEVPKTTQRTSEAKKPQPKLPEVKEAKPEQQPAKPVASKVKERELLPEELVASADVLVAAFDLRDAYRANPVAADAEYKGKRLCTTSEVRSIGTAIGRLRVSLHAGEGLTDEIECYFAKDRTADVQPLQPGYWVCVVGTCRGKIGLVTLDSCRVVLWAEDGKQLNEKLRELAARTKQQ
jgi:hypothetical protein